MRNNQAISPEGYRRKLGFTAFALLTLLAAFLSAGCGGGGTVAPPNTGAALGDTPIVISGGSTDIEMDFTTFKPVPGNANKFSSTNTGKFASVIVYDDSESAKEEDLISFVLPSSGKCSVILTHRDGTITLSNETTDKIEVEFDTARLKPRLRTPPGKALQHFSRKMKLDTIEVKAGGSAVACQDFGGATVPCKLPPGNRFTVEVWFQ